MIDHFKNPESFKDFVDTIGNIHVELDEPEESLVVWVSLDFWFIVNFQKLIFLLNIFYYILIKILFIELLRSVNPSRKGLKGLFH